MVRSKKVTLASILLLILVAAGVMWFTPLHSSLANLVSPHSNLPYDPQANGPYTVKGNTILDANGQPYYFHGVGRDGLEFLCKGDGFFDKQHLAYMGIGTNGSSTSGPYYWYANTVRLPLSQSIWFKGVPSQNCTAAQYQALVKQVVDTLTALNMNVIIDLHWTDANGQAAGGAPWAMTDKVSVTFWQQVAKIYGGYTNVLFELYNEPHPGSNDCLISGCTITNEQENVSGCQCTQTFSYQAVGMQTLVNTVRAAGASNIVAVGGINWGYDLRPYAATPLTGSSVVYDTHPYPYSGKMPPDWDAGFGNFSATAPVLSLESGQYDCKTDFMSQLLPYLDAHKIGWTAWAWYATGGTGCGYPQVITDYLGTPSIQMGYYVFSHLLTYAGQQVPPPPTPNPVVGPVNQQWYFAEGRVGGGFQEFLTLGNPTQNPCTVQITYLEQFDRGGLQTKTVTATINASTRVTRHLDTDIGVSVNGPGVSVASMVSVTNTSTCSGIVAERPMYFNALGTSSGTAVVGLTKTSTTYNFADMMTGANASSYIAILNPPGGQSAHVTATYYSNGTVVSSQSATVSGGTRGTINPNSQQLPTHVAVAVTSDQPVVVELPTYYVRVSAGNAGTVSGASDVVGAPSAATDWEFAEGYTAPGFQENLVLSNLSTSDATATIKLEYGDKGNGITHSFTVTVPKQSQVVWNVNTAANAPSDTVSAEVTSNNPILVQREMFFHYQSSVNATGVTNVLGLVAPAQNSYSFAEGFVATGFNEWLTILNPNSSNETATVTLVNSLGQSYSFYLTLAATSRQTVNIGDTVRHFLYNGSNSAGYEISMSVQSSGTFLAERPMYWNGLSGTQGGSDVVGYIGN